MWVIDFYMTYARCLWNPLCKSTCSGLRYCLLILVGVRFFRGGRGRAVSMIGTLQRSIRHTKKKKIELSRYLSDINKNMMTLV
jgi:hypothetical protein